MEGIFISLLNGQIKSIYFKYLIASFGSALISSIYGIVDMAVVGQYQGPSGVATLAVIAPIWNIIYSLGLLMGIGGAVLLSGAKGRNDIKSQNQYFTISLIGTSILALISWTIIILFDSQLLIFFGADSNLLPLAQKYLFPIKFTIPLFLFNQMLAAFLRNDNAPTLATIAVLTGGVFNIFGDLFFVFNLNMGISGAGLATSLGALISFIIMIFHFFTKQNTLKIIKTNKGITKIKEIIAIGVPTFIVDVSMGILTVIFNKQIMKYLGINALSVYGIVVNISTVVQCCAYSVGQASQPIISINYGAKKFDRIRETLKYSIYTSIVIGLIWTLLICSIPNVFVRIFMTPTDIIYKIAPFILKSYGIYFMLLPINIFSTFYFQSIMKPLTSFIISISRGVIISGLLIISLPKIIGPDFIWFSMFVTEIIVVIYALFFMKKYTK